MTQKLLNYCFNPHCRKPQNLDETLFCQYCGSSLQLADRYRAIQILGQGASSRTLLAVDRSGSSPSLCAIKQFWSDATSFYPMRRAFQSLAILESCPPIPQYLEQFEYDGVLYLVQQYIPGENLAHILAHKGPFSIEAIWQILASLLPAIRQIHACGVIHGDIKPENIICRVRANPSLKNLVLVDFGTAQLPSEMAIVQPKAAIGSPTYASPEQLQGQLIFEGDLYSLGVTCIHLLTGVHPFGLFDAADDRWVWRDYWLLDATDERERLEQQHLAQFLDRLIEPVLERRIASAQKALEAIGNLRGQPGSVTVTPAVRSWRCSATLVGHRSSPTDINAIAIAPDGQMLASAGDGRTICLWNLQERKEQFVLHGHTQGVKTLAFHPQESNILVSGSRDRTIKLWDLQTLQVTQTLTGHGQAVNAVLFSTEKLLLASGSADRQVKLWNPETGGEIVTLKGHTLAVTALAFNSSSSEPLLASASADATVRLWNLKTFEWVYTLTGHTAAVRAVAFSPDSHWLATAGDDRTILLWDLRSRQYKRTLSGHPWVVSALAFSSDGETLISGSWDKTVKLWQVRTGRQIELLTGHTDSIACLAIAPDGNTIVTGSYDRTIKLWNLLKTRS